MLAEYAGHWKELNNPVMAAVRYKCQICSAPAACKTKIKMVAKPAPRSLSIIINLRLWRSTIAPAMGEISKNGVMKNTCINPSAVALCVFS